MELPAYETPDPNWDYDKIYEVNGYNFVWIKHTTYMTGDEGERHYSIGSTHPEPDKEYTVSGLQFMYTPNKKVLKYSSMWQVDEVRGQIFCENTEEAEFFAERIMKSYGNIISTRYKDSNIIINSIDDLN